MFFLYPSDAHNSWTVMHRLIIIYAKDADLWCKRNQRHTTNDFKLMIGLYDSKAIICEKSRLIHTSHDLVGPFPQRITPACCITWIPGV